MFTVNPALRYEGSRRAYRLQNASASSAKGRGFCGERSRAARQRASSSSICKFEEDNVGAVADQQVSIFGLDKGSAAKRDDGWSGGVLNDPPQSISLDLAKALLSLGGKHLVDVHVRAAFDFAIEIEEVPAENRREHAANGALARSHEAGEGDDGRRIRLGGLRRLAIKKTKI